MKLRFLLSIVAPIQGIALLLFVLGLSAAWYVHQLHRDVSDRLATQLEYVRTAETMVLELRDARLSLNRYCVNRARHCLEDASEDLRQSGELLQHWIKQPPTDLTDDMLSKLRLGQQTAHRRVRELLKLPEPLPDSSEVDTVVMKMTGELLDPAERSLKEIRLAVIRESDRNLAIADRIGLGFLALATSGAVAGVVMGFSVARKLNRTLVQLSMPIRDTAGKLNEVVGPISLSAEAGLVEMSGVLRTIAAQTSMVVQRLQTSQREALRAEQMAAVGQLAAGMAHELRNPLMAMKMLVESANDPQNPEGLSRRDLCVLEEELSRLEHLVQSFLDFARPPDPAFQSVDLRQVVEHTLPLVQGRASRLHVTLDWQPPPLPVSVHADPLQLRQVLLNLVFNALDALPKGGVIQLRTQTSQAELLDHDRSQAPVGLLSVHDSGKGLPQGFEERIFEPFYSTKDTGVGLGLAICRRIVNAHHGKISATNRPEGGAEFLVSIPAATRNTDTSQPTNPVRVPLSVES